ncbi:MAG: hypothetical protein JSV14_10745 [Deltaproteobacteria bacterium]|nr:MAG: hypothetical protein JSV14_10745 [Deltaproteobacteria bacterium]
MNEVNYNTAYNFVKGNYSKWDLGFVLRTPTLRVGSRLRISDSKKIRMKKEN